MKTFSPEISLCLLILFLISQQLLFYFLFCVKILTKQVTAMNRKIVLTLLLMLLSLTGCNTVEPPSGLSIELKLEDKSCTEVWLTLSSNLKLPAAVDLKQSNNVVKTINLVKPDTMLYINSLLPNTSYIFQAVNDGNRVSSNAVNVTTLDTTSQNFSFQTWTFGGAASSSLRDVAIIDRDNIWCVGEIYMNDSLGNPDPIPYNAVHWDGSQWELKRITVLYRGSLITPPLYGIFAFSDNEIWLSSGVPIKGDGTNWAQYHLFDMGILTQNDGYLTKIWGTSSTDLYYVGTKGTIARYLNGTWSKINSGTNLNINDIWGTFDNEGNQYILCTAYNFATGGEKKLLRIRNFVVDEISWTGNRELYMVWFNSKYKIYAGGEGLFNLTNSNWKEEQLPPYFIFSTRGDNHNNIFAAGGFGFCAQFNGLRWNMIEEVGLTSGNYERLDIKGNAVALVGFEGNAAVITIGVKQ